LGQNVEKWGEKVENHFSPYAFFKGSRNLILLSQIHPSKNEIVHKKLSSLRFVDRSFFPKFEARIGTYGA
jgi:hypothetical protein